jgi:hypothetical protein
MTLDRTPRGPSSTARTLERASTPAFAAETWAWYGVPEEDDGEEMRVSSGYLVDESREGAREANLGSEESRRCGCKILGTFEDGGE